MTMSNVTVRGQPRFQVLSPARSIMRVGTAQECLEWLREIVGDDGSQRAKEDGWRIKRRDITVDDVKKEIDSLMGITLATMIAHLGSKDDSARSLHNKMKRSEERIAELLFTMGYNVDNPLVYRKQQWFVDSEGLQSIGSQEYPK